ncbi:hypothetical protein DFJ74DRAFT_680955 [Hyaloraphidium curvatum]|nr:hypothetical protein DFJ74DRAFT_680955 [Hyaloraphidium curvatum]
MRFDIGQLNAPSGFSLERDGRFLTLRAGNALSGIATGRFASPAASVAIRFDAPDVEYLGFAFTQFALPVVAGPALDFNFRPAHNLSSPSCVGILLARGGGKTVLVAPVTSPHEQIVAVGKDGLSWGLHGDLDTVPAGFAATVGIYEAKDATTALAAWAQDLHPLPIRPAAGNPITSHLSYWTDNGAAYWYRTEPGKTIGGSLADAVEALRAAGVPLRAVELDSWAYPHEVLRPIAEIGYPAEVPPTGMATWTPRADSYDAGGLEALVDRLGRPPIVIHSRHISPNSPYLKEGEWWVDAQAAHPTDPAFFRRWFDDAVRWGLCAIEQDWMLMYWFGVRGLREAPGRAAEWQRGLDRHAADTGLGLIWCMATPADFIYACSLQQVVAIRTCDDYRFAEDPAFLWMWYLTVNRLASTLNLRAFKDVFFSGPPGDDPIDGDPHAELEALLSALSSGPVGIGDRIGRTDPAVVMRTCDADGTIRHVDRPAGLIDACLFGAPARGEKLAWATAVATAEGGEWTYVVAINVGNERREIADALPLADIGIQGPRSVLDWRAGKESAADRLQAKLAARDWSYWVVAPAGRSATEGDTSKYVTVPTSKSESSPRSQL